jgi:hypothetical protein
MSHACVLESRALRMVWMHAVKLPYMVWMHACHKITSHAVPDVARDGFPCADAKRGAAQRGWLGCRIIFCTQGVK